MDIRVLGAHNLETKGSGLISLLVDGVLAIDAGSLTSTLSPEAQAGIREILLTHQHYDHVRDIPTIAMSRALGEGTIDIYSTPMVCRIITDYLLDGRLYPRFLELPPENPTVRLREIEPLTVVTVGGYAVLAVPVPHSELTVGYQVTSAEGKSFFYTADTGPGMGGCWQHISPDLLIIEVTMPDRYRRLAEQSGHLTPGLLGQELAVFKKQKGYLPPVITVHMNPMLEWEIETEIEPLATSLGVSINLAFEGMEIRL